LVVTLLGPSTAASAAPVPSKLSPGQYRFGIEPATASGADGRPEFSIEATPGGLVFDHVALLNYSAVPLTLQLSAADALETDHGGFGLLPPGQKSVGVGAWISGPTGDASIVVPAGTSAGPAQVVVPFTLQVPFSATPGDHVGAILATLQSVGTNRTGQRIVLDQRVGTRVYLRVSGVVQPGVTISSVRAVYGGTLNPFGRAAVTVDYVLTNTGNVDIGLASQSVTVSGLVDDTHRVSVPKLNLVLPGSAVTEQVVVPDEWPQLRLHASVTVHPVVVTGTNATPLAEVTAGTSTWAIPWTLLLIIVLIVLAVIYARRRSKKHRAQGLPATTKASGKVSVPA
jgi:hypothetical protein